MEQASCSEGQGYVCVCADSQSSGKPFGNINICVISAVFVSFISQLCAMFIFCVCLIVCICVCVFVSTPMHAPYEHAEREEVDRHMSMNKRVALKLENSFINRDSF